MTARQLALPFAHAPHFDEAFLPCDASQPALVWTARIAAWPAGRLALWGDPGSGKTHLLHAWARRHHATLLDGAALHGDAFDVPAALEQRAVLAGQAPRPGFAGCRATNRDLVGDPDLVGRAVLAQRPGFPAAPGTDPGTGFDPGCGLATRPSSGTSPGFDPISGPAPRPGSDPRPGADRRAEAVRRSVPFPAYGVRPGPLGYSGDTPAILHPVGPPPLAIDDADLAGEETLLHLINAAGEAGRPLLLAARAAPSRWDTRLPDLRSRLRATTAVELGPPDDALLRALLARLLAERQLSVAEGVQDWLLARLPRTGSALREAAARLDRASLAAGRRVTRALAAGILPDPPEDPHDHVAGPVLL